MFQIWCKRPPPRYRKAGYAVRVWVQYSCDSHALTNSYERDSKISKCEYWWTTRRPGSQGKASGREWRHAAQWHRLYRRRCRRRVAYSSHPSMSSLAMCEAIRFRLRSLPWPSVEDIAVVKFRKLWLFGGLTCVSNKATVIKSNMAVGFLGFFTLAF